jgi:hypothetical protein
MWHWNDWRKSRVPIFEGMDEVIRLLLVSLATSGAEQIDPT